MFGKLYCPAVPEAVAWLVSNTRFDGPHLWPFAELLIVPARLIGPYTTPKGGGMPWHLLRRVAATVAVTKQHRRKGLCLRNPGAGGLGFFRTGTRSESQKRVPSRPDQTAGR